MKTPLKGGAHHCWNGVRYAITCASAWSLLKADNKRWQQLEFTTKLGVATGVVGVSDRVARVTVRRNVCSNCFSILLGFEVNSRAFGALLPADLAATGRALSAADLLVALTTFGRAST